MERKNCVICGNTINFLYKLKNMPICLATTLEDITNDKVMDQYIFNCDNCNCVQIKNLIDPSILYGSAHNLTFNLPLWNEHHTEFIKFVTNKNHITSIMEIGGSSGALYNKIKELNINNIKYSCIDICEANYDTSGIEYITDNCENYEFKNTDCIVMSHIFEHLYEPIKLIENLSKSNIKDIYISIPNMTKLLENKSPSILHYEHTYFIDKLLSEYLFSHKGYELKDFFDFKTHSYFMKFSKTNCPKMNIVQRKYITNEIYNIYTNIYNRFSKYILEQNSFIVPGGHLGQLFYSINLPTNILGFLDNDTSKQGKRQYGTPFRVYPFSKLNEYTDSIKVYIYGGPYVDEILLQLKQYSHIQTIIV
jgi:hypothetical protein